MEYAEKYYSIGSDVDLATIINKCYPPKLAKELQLGIIKLRILSINQHKNGDDTGAEVWMEDDLFNNLNI